MEVTVDVENCLALATNVTAFDVSSSTSIQCAEHVDNTGKKPTKGTQTPGHVFIGGQGEVIITTNYTLVKLVLNNDTVQRLIGTGTADVDEITGTVLKSLVRLDWNGDGILKKAMTSFRLTLRNELLPQLIREVARILVTEQEHHRVQQLAQGLMERLCVKLFGVDMGSLVFIVEHSSSDDARETLESTQRQREVQNILLSFLPEWICSHAVWAVSAYAFKAEDAARQFGFNRFTTVSFVASLDQGEDVDSEADFVHESATQHSVGEEMEDREDLTSSELPKIPAGHESREQEEESFQKLSSSREFEADSRELTSLKEPTISSSHKSLEQAEGFFEKLSSSREFDAESEDLTSLEEPTIPSSHKSLEQAEGFFEKLLSSREFDAESEDLTSLEEPTRSSTLSYESSTQMERGFETSLPSREYDADSEDLTSSEGPKTFHEPAEEVKGDFQKRLSSRAFDIPLRDESRGAETGDSTEHQSEVVSPGSMATSKPPRAVRSEMAIPLSEPQRDLLNNNDVVEELLTRLQAQDILVEMESLHTDRIVVLQGDPMRARECIASLIHSDVITFTPRDESEVISSLTDLRRRFSSQCAVHFGQGNQAEIAFLPSVRREVQRVVDDLKHGKKLLPLPGYWLEYLQPRLQDFAAKINSNFSKHSPVELSIVPGPGGHPHLQLKCDRTKLPEAERVLQEKLVLLWHRKVEVSASLGGFLQSSAGTACLGNIESSHRCDVNVKTQGERVLLEARSPQGHEVKVCEGSLAMTECSMIVLPLRDGLEKWQPSYEAILERGLLNANPARYLSRMGAPPKPLTRALQCQDLASGQTVVIMYVVRRSDPAFRDLLSTALAEVLALAANSRCGLALPLKLCDDMDSDVIGHVLTTVRNYHDDNSLPPVTQFYLESEAAWSDEVSSIFQTRGWTTELPTDSVDKLFDDRVKVSIGEILTAQGDVVVNPTDPKLEHIHGQVSKVLLNHLGEDLTRQCTERYSGGIGDRTVAVTDVAHDVPFKFRRIFHVVPPQFKWDDSNAKELLQALRTRMEACLRSASAQGLGSIVFPALGTGTLRYPADQEARTVLEATRDFLAHMPHTTLRSITFVTYKKNPEVARVFKAEEYVSRYGLRLSADCGRVDRRFEMRGVLVQVIKGDARTRRCTARLLLCGDPPSTGTLPDYTKQMAPDCSLATVNKSHVRNDVRDVLKTATAASAQLNMQMFDAEHVDSIVSGIEKAGSQTVQIIVIVVQASDVFLRLCNKLARSCTPVTKGSRDDKAFARVGVCGSRKDTEDAVKKILGTEVSDNYTQAEKCGLHPSFLEPAGTSSGQAARSGQMPATTSPAATPSPSPSPGAPTLSQQAAEEVTFTLPRHDLKGLDMGTILDAFENLDISVSFRRGNAKFRTDHGNFAQLNAQVQGTLATLTHRAQQTAPAERFPRHGAAGQGAAAVLPPPAERTAEGPGEDGGLTASAVLQSAGSLKIPSTFMTRQPSSSREFDKNISQGETPGGGGGQPGREDAGNRSATFPQASAHPLPLPPQASGTGPAADPTKAAGSAGESKIMSDAESEALAFLIRLCPSDKGSSEAGSLRREEIHLSPRELVKLGSSLDCQSEGITAYVKVLPDLKKVVVFAFDYASVTKAAHLVKVKCGKIVVRSRSKGKADQRAASAFFVRDTGQGQRAEASFMTQTFHGQQAPEKRAARGKTVEKVQYVTRKGLKVSVYTGDITKAQVDAIVSAAHEKLTHEGGVAAAIATAAGTELRDESTRYIAQNGALKVTEVAVTTSGALPCGQVLHAVGPRWAAYSDKKLCQQHLADTIFQCLLKAEGLGLQTLAFTSVSSGIFGVPHPVCAQSYLEGVLAFEDARGDGAGLRTIHFIDLQDDLVGIIQDVFAARWGAE